MATAARAPGTASIEPFGIVRRVLHIYAAQARTLLPLSLVVAAVEAATSPPLGLVQLAGSLLAILLVALFYGVAIQLGAAVERPAGTSSARTVARQALAAVLPSAAVTLIVALVTGIVGVLVLAALAADLLSGHGSLRTVTVAIGVVGVLVTPLLLTRWAVVVPVAVLERTGVGEAFRRNRALVRGHGRRVLATLVILYLPLGALNVLLKLLAPGSDVAGRAALDTVTLPIYALTSVVLYLALLETAPAIGAAPGDAPPSGPPPRQPWLTKGTRGRLALWSVLSLLWFLFLPDYLASAPSHRHVSVPGAVVWAIVLALLLRCAWITRRRMRVPGA